MDFDESAFWNLRRDFGMPRGLKMDTVDAEASGADLNVCVEFQLTKNIFMECGYRYINLDSEVCDRTYNWLSGVVRNYGENFETEIERDGFYAMGRMKFKAHK